ncbi:glutamate-1-semialdehyde aminotransferase [hydrocarbon metagenome]|uniref:glutamate-1-semialdehyde 2,1-aminomutase n=1 Tax=hydrocarbon metagenome TaxID=938273 RepID=A0A0W8E8C3_9ZZZZ
MNEPIKSRARFARAQQLMPGGVNSPVRAFKAVGLDPLFIEKASGSKIYDIDSNEYIDYVCSWGPLILGHAHPEIVRAICQAAELGTSYGAPSEKEIELAELICEAIPSIDKVRMVNSGTEATMSAARLARAYTGRDKILKFEGCYHGHADSFLIKAGSGLLTSGVPTSPGIPKDYAGGTLVSRYNDIESVQKIFDLSGRDIAAVIVEPIAGNMGLIVPETGFLQELRSITDQYGSLLIFDEVISGFRTCYGGYQNLIDVKPDITTLGKIIGGGLPVGAYGGRRDIMTLVAPEGDVYQAGTLSGNPLAMAAGSATLKLLKNTDLYTNLEYLGQYMVKGLKESLLSRGLKYQINHLGSMFSLFFTDQEVKDYDTAVSSDTRTFAKFYKTLLSEGVYFPPSQFEVCFISNAHTQSDLDRTVAVIEKALDFSMLEDN